MKIGKKLRILALGALLLVGSGCGKSPLYSNVSERQANEMISILRMRNMEVSKIAGAENMWTVVVANTDFSNAVEVLNLFGYPRDDFSTLGKVFQKSGLVSSPTEERARFMYAISESIAETISHITGVVTARVNIVLPTTNSFTEAVTPSSASVFILYRPGTNMEDFIRDIKNLVTNSIEGLSYDKVSVALFPSPVVNDVISEGNQVINLLGIHMTHSSIWVFLLLLLIVAVAVAAISFVGAKILYDYMTVKRDEKERLKAAADGDKSEEASAAEEKPAESSEKSEAGEE
ncbi:MAG: type III secretion inner membrane ring lipoprotein SctJ [Puniceicoccales bacterium]|jgi:type III secretion protein J|nr:type III secretion inner membrane ring lipoprotein SctJ [Puniceicoccales bacterium]